MKQLVKKEAENIASAYLENGQDPTEQMCKVAQKHDLTARQIRPVARRANRKILQKLQKNASHEGQEPFQTFPKIKIHRVVRVVDADDPEIQDGPQPCPPDKEVESPDRLMDNMLGDFESPNKEQMSFDTDIDQYMDNPSEAPSSIMPTLLRKAKDKISNKKKKLRELEVKLDRVLENLSKSASRYLYDNNPVEPLEKLEDTDETIDGVIKEAKNRMGKLASTNGRRIELNEDHEICKLANEASELKDKINRQEVAVMGAKNKLRELKDGH